MQKSPETLPMQSNNSAIFQLEQVGLYYPKNRGLFGAEKFWALQRLDLEVHESEIVGIVGDNGAGKSTLLKLIGGILQPDQGRLWKKSDCLFTLLSLQAGFQRNLSGRDNVLINGVLLGMSRKQLVSRMEEIKALSDIGDFFEAPLRVYSNGMKSRLGFAIAYFTDPDVLLLDEILSVGDHDFALKSKALIEEKIQKGKTTLIISHSEHLLKDLCTRMIWIGEGRVLEDGSPENVWNQYRSHYRKRIGKI